MCAHAYKIRKWRPKQRTVASECCEWQRSCENGESKNPNPPFVQSTHKTVRTCKLFLLHHRRIMPAMEIRAKFPANPSAEQLLHYCKLHMSKKLWEWGVQKRKPSVCAINAQSGTNLQIVPPAPSPYNAGNGNSRKFPANPSQEQ